MKIVIINGSARKGNTLAAINAFIKGASEKNKIEIIEPDKLNIAPCKGCGVCQCSKGCVDKDDTNIKMNFRRLLGMLSKSNIKNIIWMTQSISKKLMTQNIIALI